MDAAAAIPLNIGLAFRLSPRSLKHRKMIALATLFGVAIGVGVVNAVLIAAFPAAAALLAACISTNGRF